MPLQRVRGQLLYPSLTMAMVGGGVCLFVEQGGPL